MYGLRKFTLVALALVGALISSQAMADDTKYYSGKECSAYQGSDAALFSHREGISYDHPVSTQGWNNRRWVVCPVISDRYGSSTNRTGGHVNRAWIRVNRAHPLNGNYWQDVCHLMVRRTTAGSVSSVTVSFDTQGSAAKPFPSLRNQPRFAVYWIQCLLAPGSSLQTYGIVESPGTD